MSYENAIELININKNFDRFKLKNVSFKLPKGCVMGLIGANGSGKTTIIKAIMGLNTIDSGEIKLFGKNIKNNERLKDRIGFVYDAPIGFSGYTIEKNKKIISKFYSKWDEAKFNYYLKKFSLDKYEKLCNLSKGQEMKYSLAIALSHHAELLILDEPTAGLDAVIRTELLDILFELVEEENITILYSSHITADLEKIADYITFVKEGKISFSKEKDELIEKVYIVKGDLDTLTEDSLSLIYGIRKHKYGFEGITHFKEKLEKLNKGLFFEEPTLDEIIVGFTRGGNYELD